MKDGDLDVQRRVYFYGLTLSDVMPLNELVLQISWRNARKESITVLGEAMYFLLKPHRRVPTSFFEVSLGGKETEKWFPMTVSYRHYIS